MEWEPDQMIVIGNSESTRSCILILCIQLLEQRSITTKQLGLVHHSNMMTWLWWEGMTICGSQMATLEGHYHKCTYRDFMKLP